MLKNVCRIVLLVWAAGEVLNGMASGSLTDIAIGMALIWAVA